MRLSTIRRSAVTIVRDFLRMPFLAHVVTDTHFNARDRLGRLIAFVAQVRATGDPNAVGLGIDEASTLCVDARGIGRLFTLEGGHAWLVQPTGVPKLTAGRPLDYPAVRVTGLGPDGEIDLKTMRVTKAAFAGTATVKGGRLTGVPSLPTQCCRSQSTAGRRGRTCRLTRGRSSYRKVCRGARWERRFSERGNQPRCVEAAVRVLEDNPLFNAGKGAVFRRSRHQPARRRDHGRLQPSRPVRRGCHASRNPVTLARTVMERSRHVLLSGPGADEFAKSHGVEQVDPSYFRTEKRWQEYIAWKRTQAALLPTQRYGTVGAVALDVRGHLAAATSTGGLTGKKWGRVGDSPIIGAGTYAADGLCAVSATVRCVFHRMTAQPGL